MSCSANSFKMRLMMAMKKAAKSRRKATRKASRKRRSTKRKVSRKRRSVKRKSGKRPLNAFMVAKEKARKANKKSFMYKGSKYVRELKGSKNQLVVYRKVVKKSAKRKVSRKRKSPKRKASRKRKSAKHKVSRKRKSPKRKASRKRKSAKRKSRKCKYGRDPVSGKCRKKYGGNKGNTSRSRRDY